MRMGGDINRVIITTMSIVATLYITVKSGVWEGLHLLIVPSRSKISLGKRRRLSSHTNYSPASARILLLTLLPLMPTTA